MIVWYGTASHSSYQSEPNSPVLLRAWSDGTIEGLKMTSGYQCNPLNPCSSGWFVISSPQMACRTDINGNGEIEFGDLLAVLNQWGDQQPAQTLFSSNAG